MVVFFLTFQSHPPWSFLCSIVYKHTFTEQKNTIDVSKYIKILSPAETRQLGAKLGLDYNNLRRIPDSTLHLDMADAWLVGHDNSRVVSGQPTWRALALACARHNMWGVVSQIEQGMFLSVPIERCLMSGIM